MLPVWSPGADKLRLLNCPEIQKKSSLTASSWYSKSQAASGSDRRGSTCSETEHGDGPKAACKTNAYACQAKAFTAL